MVSALHAGSARIEVAACPSGLFGLAIAAWSAALFTSEAATHIVIQQKAGLMLVNLVPIKGLSKSTHAYTGRTWPYYPSTSGTSVRLVILHLPLRDSANLKTKVRKIGEGGGVGYNKNSGA